jgi:hypothetical protein
MVKTGLRGTAAGADLSILGTVVGVLSFTVPSKVQNGAYFDAVVQLQNVSLDIIADVAVRIRDSGGALLGESLHDSLGPSQVKSFSVTLKMPNNDWTITAYAYHDGYEESPVSRTIELWILVNTTLTISLSPKVVAPLQKYDVTGRLTRADGVAVGIRDIKITGAGTLLATVKTDNDGYYVYQGTAPSYPSYPVTYNVRAEFSQVDILGASYATTQLSITELLPSPGSELLGIVATVVGTAGLLFVKVR